MEISRVIVEPAVSLLSKGAGAFAGTSNEKFAGKVDELSKITKIRFKGDPYAEQTLDRVKEMPESESRQSALRAILSEKIESDVDFAAKVKILVEEALELRDQTRLDLNQRGQTIRGPQTNIAGNVSGPVLSGSFSDPVVIEKSNRRRKS